jgi:quinol monooxygenase YgiN
MTSAAAHNPWPIVELRQYTMQPGRRDELIELFEREFIESQEAAGMQVLLHGRDLDAPHRFVWFRGFRDMPSRAPALQAFYSGAVWQAHRNAANATIVDNDDVLLLREARPGCGFELPAARPPRGAGADPGLLVATVCAFGAPVDDAFLAFFDEELAPAARAAGASLRASYISESGANEFPRLPVREGEHVFVWVAAFADTAAHAAWRAALDRSPRWRERVEPLLTQQLIAPPATIRLAPAPRSLVRA